MITSANAANAVRKGLTKVFAKAQARTNQLAVKRRLMELEARRGAGRPMMLYHGTSQFHPNLRQQPPYRPSHELFMTPDWNTAKRYARGRTYQFGSDEAIIYGGEANFRPSRMLDASRLKQTDIDNLRQTTERYLTRSKGVLQREKTTHKYESFLNRLNQKPAYKTEADWQKLAPEIYGTPGLVRRAGYDVFHIPHDLYHSYDTYMLTRPWRQLKNPKIVYHRWNIQKPIAKLPPRWRNRAYPQGL